MSVFSGNYRLLVKPAFTSISVNLPTVSDPTTPALLRINLRLKIPNR